MVAHHPVTIGRHAMQATYEAETLEFERGDRNEGNQLGQDS